MSKEENIKDLVLIQLNEDMACIKERIEEYIQGFNSYTDVYKRQIIHHIFMDILLLKVDLEVMM